MRGSRWFIFFVLAFLLLMFAIEYHLPKKFVWVPTFSHYDEQPFGCAVFDSLLTVSLPSGYTLSRKTFYQMEQEDTVHNKGILLIATNLPFGRVDIEALLKMADRGNKIMLVSSSFTKILEDTLKFDCTYSYFRSVDLKKYAASLLKRDSIYEGDCTDAAISFALFSVAKAASLGDLSVDVRYLALYGVYSTEAATGNTCHTGTGKQIP